MDKINEESFWDIPEDERYELLINKLNEIVDWINSQ